MTLSSGGRQWTTMFVYMLILNINPLTMCSSLGKADTDYVSVGVYCHLFTAKCHCKHVNIVNMLSSSVRTIDCKHCAA